MVRVHKHYVEGTEIVVRVTRPKHFGKIYPARLMLLFGAGLITSVLALCRQNLWPEIVVGAMACSRSVCFKQSRRPTSMSHGDYTILSDVIADAT